jgi:hypothetical protein
MALCGAHSAGTVKLIKPLEQERAQMAPMRPRVKPRKKKGRLRRRSRPPEPSIGSA